MILFGIGIGFSYLSVVRNCWKYFPEYKGLVSGVILSGYGIASVIYTSLCESIVNPNSMPLANDGFYSEDIAQKMYDYIFTIFFIFLVGSVLSVAMIFPYTVEEKNIGKVDHSDSINKSDGKQNLLEKNVIFSKYKGVKFRN